MSTEVNKDVPKQPLKKRAAKRAKLGLCFMVFFLVVFTICGATIGIFWAGGWLKDTTCGIVMENSYIWDKTGCEKEEVASTVDEDNVITIDLPDELTTTEELVTTIIDEVSPAVVTVAVNQLALDDEYGVVDQNDGIGSGFVVDTNGLIITNKHVVSDLDAEYSVFLPGEEEAILITEIYRDNINDIALLRVDKTGLKALKLGNSDDLKRGNLVIAIGNPFGDLEGTATVGYVTGLNRDVTAGSGFGAASRYVGVIQTDAAINPGNSGGPLINSRGEVVGVNFATTQGADNISFAIPINRVKDRLEVFEKDGRFPQPYIGVSYTQRTVVIQRQVITGAIILGVEEGGPADEAGLKRGDIVIEAGGKALANNSFMTIIQTTDVGDKLKLKVWREGEEMEIVVEVLDRGE